MARNKYPEETKNLIIDTASKLFIENGYKHTSIQDIIEHLGGLSKGAIYHHFKSKEEIMMAVAEKLYSNSSAQMYKIRERKDLNGRQKLEEVFRISIFAMEQKNMFSAAPDMMKNPQLLVIFLKDVVQKEAAQFFTELLEEGVADGSVSLEYPKETAEVLMLLGNVWMNPMIYGCSPQEMIGKAKFYQHLLKLLNLDNIVSDSMISRLEEFADIYQKTQKEG